jgi:D-3-phosphoglycerate dehydrogenase
MRIKIECPTYFFEHNLCGHAIDNEDPEIMISDPGSSYKYNESYLSKFSNLKILATPSTGVTHIDLDYCRRMQIPVLNLLSNRKLLNEISASAEFTWLHILNAVRRFSESIEEVKTGNWRNKENDLRGREMRYLSLGIVGFGRIGGKISSFASAFGMEKVFYYDPYVESNKCTRVLRLEQIFGCDIILISPYLTDETKNMISSDLIKICRRGSIIVNTSRGEVVDEDAICDAVELGQIYYCADVVKDEQNMNRFFQSRLYRLLMEGKVCITPHIAGATVESQQKAFDAIMLIIQSHLGRER